MEFSAHYGCRVHIVGGHEIYRRGLGGVLSDAGFDVVEDPDPGDDAVRMAVQDSGWADLRTPEGCDEAVCVVLGDDAGPDAYRRALALDVDALALVHASPDTIVAITRAAAQGWTMLPTDTARTMASGHETGGALGPALTQEEQGWIEMLAAGTTVHAVARAAGRSERTMFRLLRELYHRMGASNRMEAVRRIIEESVGKDQRRT
jgi:DNA-binding NarL/FixJ family response regulator